MDFNGEIVFAVSDSSRLDVDFGSKFLSTKIINKGDVITLERKAPQNRWLHMVKFKNQNIFLERLDELTNERLKLYA